MLCYPDLLWSATGTARDSFSKAMGDNILAHDGASIHGQRPWSSAAETYQPMEERT